MTTRSGTRRAVRAGTYRQGRSLHDDGPLVLVVDDYDHTREMYAEFLSFVGFRVAEAATAEAALDLARRLRPSAVVMDLALPGMSGWEAAACLRRDVRRRLPIIAVTASCDPSFRAAALGAGCDAFMQKPVGPNALADAIGDLLRQT
jgi:CheY-like chemotaxis protein